MEIENILVFIWIKNYNLVQVVPYDCPVLVNMWFNDWLSTISSYSPLYNEELVSRFPHPEMAKNTAYMAQKHLLFNQIF